jgi:YVTN family beta-propeller protein
VAAYAYLRRENFIKINHSIPNIKLTPMLNTTIFRIVPKMISSLKLLGFVCLFLSLSDQLSAQPFAYLPNFFSDNVSVIDLATNSEIATIPVGFGPFGVAVNADGSRVYVTNQSSSSVSVIDAATNSVIATIGVGSAPEGVAVSLVGKVYVANAADNTVSIINAATNTVITTLPVGETPHGILVSPNRSMVYVSNFVSGDVTVIDAFTDAVVATIPVGAGPQGLATSPRGFEVYVANRFSSDISVIDAATNTVKATINNGLGTIPFDLAASPSGLTLYATNLGAGSVSVIDATTNMLTGTIPVGAGPRGISFTTDGAALIVANGDNGTASVINAATNTVAATVTVGNTPIAFGVSVAPPPPPPAIPTLGQWGMILFLLINMVLGLAVLYNFQYKKQLAVVASYNSIKNQSVVEGWKMRNIVFPFDRADYLKKWSYSFSLVVIGLPFIYFIWGEIVVIDLLAMMLVLPILNYLIYLGGLMKR